MNTDVFYQIPSYTTFIVQDLQFSTRWYQEILGFELIFQMPGPGGQPSLSHLRWAKYADLMLMAEPSENSDRGLKGSGVTLTFAVTKGSVDAIASRARNNGYPQVSGPHNRPWKAREVIIIDPDGYRLTFSEALHSTEDLEDVVGKIIEEAGLETLSRGHE